MYIYIHSFPSKLPWGASESCFVFSTYVNVLNLDDNHDSRQARLNSLEELPSPTITSGSAKTQTVTDPILAK